MLGCVIPEEAIEGALRRSIALHFLWLSLASWQICYPPVPLLHHAIWLYALRIIPTNTTLLATKRCHWSLESVLRTIMKQAIGA